MKSSILIKYIDNMKIENIKFKAKRLDNGKWAEGSLLQQNFLGGMSL